MDRFSNDEDVMDDESNHSKSLNQSYEAPLKEDQESKLAKFKEFMFNNAKNIDTSDLLERIVKIIDVEKPQTNNQESKENESLSTKEKIEQMFLNHSQDNRNLEVCDVKTLIEKKEDQNIGSNYTTSEEIKQKKNM